MPGAPRFGVNRSTHAVTGLYCLDCHPRRPGHPPYLPIGYLPTWHRQHLARYPSHRLAYWCTLHRRFEDSNGREIAGWNKRDGIVRDRAPAGSCSCGLTLDRCTPSRIPPLPPLRRERGRLLKDTSAEPSTTPTDGRPTSLHATAHPAAPAPSTMTGKGRGGRRPGAGAPKGNKNALRTGRYVGDAELRQLRRMVPDEIWQRLVPYLKGGINQTPATAEAPVNVVQLRPLPTTSTTTPPQSKIPDEHAGIIQRLESYGFRGAADFTRRHGRYAAEIVSVLDHVDTLSGDVYAVIANPAGLIRDTLHREIGQPVGGVLVCPSCRWTDTIAPQEETGT